VRIIIAAAVSFVAMLSSGDLPGSPEETVRQFSQAEFDGRTLTSDGPAHVAALLSRPLLPVSEIVIVREFRVACNRPEGDRAHCEVDYAEIGRLDAALHFRRSEGLRARVPVRRDQSIGLERAGPVTPPGQGTSGPGHRRWLIATYSRGPHISLDAAIRHVTRTRDTTRDATIRGNAEHTLRTLTRLAAGEPAQPDVIVAQTPLAVVDEFVRLDSAGAQATRAGLQTLAPLFAQPIRTSPPAIAGVMGYVEAVAAVIHSDDRAEVMLQGIVLFELNLETARVDAERYGTGGIKWRSNVTLGLTKEGGRPRWTIEGPLPMPALTIDGALSHVKQLRATTTDARIKRQATLAIASLERQR
jgi:hypothetical protein